MDPDFPASPASSPLGAPLVGAFGKLPKVGDFVRVGLQNEATRNFEEWLHQGVQVAHEKRGNAWKDTFAHGRVYAFVYRSALASGETALLGGLLAPSADAVGRTFPLVTFMPIGRETASCLLPHVMGGYLDQAAGIAARAAELTQSDLESAVRGLGGLDHAAGAPNAYSWWTRTTRLSTLWAEIYGNDDLSYPAYSLYLLLELARSLRGRALADTPLALRVPLGRAGVAAASFWLDVLRVALRWQAVTPTFFWTFDGHRGDLLVQLGRTPPSSFAELWWPDSRNDAMTSLIDIRPFGDSFSRLPSPLQQCLERPHATVAELLLTIG